MAILWLSRVNWVKLNFRLYPLVASAHRGIHSCLPRQLARFRALDVAIMHWLHHLHGAAWLVRSGTDTEEDSDVDDDFETEKDNLIRAWLLKEGMHVAFVRA